MIQNVLHKGGKLFKLANDVAMDFCAAMQHLIAAVEWHIFRSRMLRPCILCVISCAQIMVIYYTLAYQVPNEPIWATIILEELCCSCLAAMS